MFAVRLHKKYAVIPLVTSIIIAISLWARDTGENLNPRNYREFGDIRVLPRDKRQSYSYKLHDVYMKFYKASQCCKKPMPYLLPEDGLTSCPPADANGAYVTKSKKKAGQRRVVNQNKKQRSTNWFQQISNTLSRTVRRTTNQGKKAKKAKNAKQNIRLGRQSEAAQKISLKFVCYNDCVFNEMGLMNGSSIDLDAVEQTFLSTNQDSGWAQYIQDALYTCEEPSACATPESLLVSGFYYSIRPTILMNCMYKQLLNNCDRKQTIECNTAFSQVRKLDVFKQHRS
ncbi:Hypothetical predicted protein [Cloeon dipterum]|uniref:Uncharacterized protein n=3 Tax=Cloeon dipterum TaxID=197152 RepID=A0A8S1DUH9_9INSE|nr:Hypothetical predicted protein [Cloeon dipterum]